MHRTESQLFYIVTAIAGAVWWFYPEQWFWVAATWLFACAVVFDIFALLRNGDAAVFLIVLLVQAMTAGAVALWYLYPSQWWWIIPVWFCSFVSVRFSYLRLSPILSAPSTGVEVIIKTASLALYFVSLGVFAFGMHWALKWLAPGLSFVAKAALSIPLALLIQLVWPWPLPFWMTWEWVLHGRKQTSAKVAYRRGEYATAFELVQPLAVDGDATAQYNLGLMYHKGHGVPKDYDQALKWYRLAAAQNHAIAQNNLGIMCEYGEGVPQNYDAALKWFRLAAAQGEAAAQTNLGGM